MYLAIAIVMLVLSVIICHVVAKKRDKNPVFWARCSALWLFPLCFFRKKRTALE